MIKKTAQTQSSSDAFTRILKDGFGLECVKEYRFYPKRQWRFDYAIVEHKIALEVEGGVWTEGRHVRGYGFLNDIEKYNKATVMGWRVLRTTPKNLYTAKTYDMVMEIIKGDKTREP